MTIRTKAFLSALVFFALLTAYSLRIPFFWDGTFFSEIAVRFYDSGFHPFPDPAAPDTGGFPLYPAYMALAWKCFGKSLPVSHLAMLPFVAGIAFEYIKTASRFLKPSFVFAALLLLLCEPVFVTQSILMGYDILMVYFFMLALNALLSDKKLLFSAALLLLCLSSMRGIFLGASLLLTDLFLCKKITAVRLARYIPAVLGVIAWAAYHGHVTGWFFFSPARTSTHEAVVPLPMMLRQILFIGWKVNDFGRALLWLFLITYGVILYRKSRTPELKTLLLLIFIPLIVLTACLAPFANPIGHKYFIVVFLLLNTGACYLLQTVKRTFRYFLLPLFAVALLSGNFWIYPERYGNGWDSSLKVLPYFNLEKEMDLYIRNNRIPAALIGTQFPLIADKRFSMLGDTSYAYRNVWRGPVRNYAYFLYSNVINTDIPDQVEAVKKNWEAVKELHAGEVDLTLYKAKTKPALE